MTALQTLGTPVPRLLAAGVAVVATEREAFACCGGAVAPAAVVVEMTFGGSNIDEAAGIAVDIVPAPITCCGAAGVTCRPVVPVEVALWVSDARGLPLLPVPGWLKVPPPPPVAVYLLGSTTGKKRGVLVFGVPPRVVAAAADAAGNTICWPPEPLLVVGTPTPVRPSSGGDVGRGGGGSGASLTSGIKSIRGIGDEGLGCPIASRERRKSINLHTTPIYKQ